MSESFLGMEMSMLRLKDPADKSVPDQSGHSGEVADEKWLTSRHSPGPGDVSPTEGKVGGLAKVPFMF